MGGAPLNLQGLSPDEYLKAEAELTVQQKAALAGHLAASLKKEGGEDFAPAEALLRVMAWNAEPPVAEAMAKAAAANPDTPRSVAWALANDDEGPAACVLKACAALSDADLVSIVQSSESQVKMGAIARRATVSADVSQSLVEHGDEDVVHALLDNQQAEVADDAYGRALDRFGQSERIQEGIINRPTVSAPVVQRLSASISPALASKFADKFEGKFEGKSADKTPGTAIPGHSDVRSDSEWAAHFSQATSDRLFNESTLVSHLTRGNLEYFARALSALSKAPYTEVIAAVLESPPAFAPFWQRAGLPMDWLPVAAAATAALIHVDRSAGKSDAKIFSRNIVDRTVANLKANKVVLSNAQRHLFARATKR